MGACRAAYRAVNEVTGEVLTGTSRELEERLHISRRTIYQYSMCEITYKGEWRFERVSKEKEQTNCKIPRELLEEWEWVTQPFREWAKKFHSEAN